MPEVGHLEFAPEFVRRLWGEWIDDANPGEAGSDFHVVVREYARSVKRHGSTGAGVPGEDGSQFGVRWNGFTPFPGEYALCRSQRTVKNHL